jgi:hypothetical protein
VDTRKLGAVAGIVGSVAFVAIFTIEGWLRPGYDAQRMFVSELALGERGLVQILMRKALSFLKVASLALGHVGDRLNFDGRQYAGHPRYGAPPQF